MYKSISRNTYKIYQDYEVIRCFNCSQFGLWRNIAVCIAKLAESKTTLFKYKLNFDVQRKTSNKYC